MVEDKNIFKKMQKDLMKSNPNVVNCEDDLSKIKKNLGPKYTEDISDSELDDLSSYKLRHRNTINQLALSNNKQKEVKPNKSTKLNKKSNSENLSKSSDLDKNSEKNSEKNLNKKSNNSDNSDNLDNLDNSDNSDNDTSSSEDVGYEYTEELANKVKLYVKNDDRIRELQTELRKLNSEKKVAEMDILKHLERLGETNINITGGKLRINQYESKGSLAEDVIREAIQEKIKDPKLIETIFEKINERRVANAKIQVSLKRTFERGKK